MSINGSVPFSSAGLSEADLAKLLISGILTEEFGPGIANAPPFQALAEQVHAALDRDPECRALLLEALNALNEA